MRNWADFISRQKQQAYFQDIELLLQAERMAGEVIYPPEKEVFSAFELTPFEQIKVLILGQDPYHGEGQAHGLAFSVKDGACVPPSLANIYKELVRDIPHFVTPDHGCLLKWAQQGVLLLNTALTVKKGQAHSHAKIGWTLFTDQVIRHVSQYQDRVVFLLWGNHAQGKIPLIDQSKHLILTAAHPSPLSAYRGFFGCAHFSQANQYLAIWDRSTIDWQP